MLKRFEVENFKGFKNNMLNSWVTIDGTPSKNREETHYKIKKREEM